MSAPRWSDDRLARAYALVEEVLGEHHPDTRAGEALADAYQAIEDADTWVEVCVGIPVLRPITIPVRQLDPAIWGVEALS